jgi:ADP-heptose:LPS heptosyltransferase
VSKTIDLNDKTVVISRTDSIGDVMLTLPMCAWIKENYPTCKIVFLGRNYTRPVIECFPIVDEIHSYDELELLPVQGRVEAIKTWKADVFIHVFPHKEIAKIAKKAKVKNRIGTSHRSFHLLTCDIRLNFTRKKADEHEAQLNFELLRPFGLEELPSLVSVQQQMRAFRVKHTLTEEQSSLLIPSKKLVILHPKSQGSAVEWPLENYTELALQLADKGHRVFFTGTEKEGRLFKDKIPTHENIVDVTGRFSLNEFIAFIDKVDALVACSTGPLHIAAALNKCAVGLYINKRPMHPGRWSALGENTNIFVADTKEPKETDIALIGVDEVFRKLMLP